MPGLLVLFELAVVLLVTFPVDCRAVDRPVSREGMTAASQQRDAAGKERRREREKRSIIRMVDDMNGSLSHLNEEIAALEKEIDAITLLESPQREKDFTNLLDWYRDYVDWLTRSSADLEDSLALASIGSATGNDELWKDRYNDLAKSQVPLAKELEKRVKRYSAEEKRLAGILERRREMQQRSSDLQSRLDRIERRLGELAAPSPERSENERKAEKFRAEIRVVQNELLSLPLVGEDILKHYAVLVERGNAEIDWLSLKREEYAVMRDLAMMNVVAQRRDAIAIEAGYRQAVRQLESQISRLSRKKNELDRKRSRVMPAGSLREVALSRELADFYERLQGRYDSETGSLRVLIGACDAELAEILSEK